MSFVFSAKNCPWLLLSNCRLIAAHLYIFLFFFLNFCMLICILYCSHIIHSFMAWWNVIRTFSYLVFFYVFHYFVFKRNCAENVLVIGNFFSTSSLCFDYQNHFHMLHAHHQQSTCAKFTQICKMKMIMVLMMKFKDLFKAIAKGCNADFWNHWWMFFKLL